MNFSQLPTLLIATTNAGKAHELTAALAGLSIDIRTLRDIAPHEPPAETGTTFADNATIKAEWWCARTGLPTLADDSGIVVDALANELGVTTRRWGMGETATDEAWLAYFLERMKDVPMENRDAAFVCVLALTMPDGQTHLFEGCVRGVITDRPLAPIERGIPLSSVFVAEGTTTVFSAMTTNEKNAHSHRGRAITALKIFLAKLPV